MKYLAEIIFGKDQIRKYHNNETLNDYEKIINLKKYIFETWAERNAFYKESGEKDNKEEKEDEHKFDYWAFIEKYYPKYSHCDNILLSDILTRKLEGEEICEQDEENIKDWNIRKELFDLDKNLLCEAFENYFNIAYPKN
jgi:hypothetical protein